MVDGFAGWDPQYRIKVRVICARAYHALFMHNMLIRPTPDEMATFGDPDYVIYNAGQFPANPHTQQMTSRTSIDISLERREMVILGTEYAGEMKKGVFTLMHYVMPGRGVLSMHCSANEGDAGDVSLFFGLSGTGKTTLSADPRRRLIGDDEHCWSDEGIFNIEGGCYAKCINLTRNSEPEIYDAIRFGTVLENVVYDEESRAVDFDERRHHRKHPRRLSDRIYRQRQGAVRRRPSAQHYFSHLRCLRRDSAGQPTDPRAGDVSLPQRLHSPCGGHGRGRQGAAGGFFRLL